MTQEWEPLLQNGGAGNATAPALLPSLARSVLKFLMWAVFLSWTAGIFLYPTKPAQAAFSEWAALTKQSIFGVTGTQPTRISALVSLFRRNQGKVGAGIDRSEAGVFVIMFLNLDFPFPFLGSCRDRFPCVQRADSDRCSSGLCVHLRLPS
jgi:hypothetical protein